MLNHTRRLFRSQVTWGITLVLLAPTFAQAQQTGLMPLAPIRRQRVPCPEENPVYRRYRTDYYGYYPTCWRRFPPGWGCPSPEAPDMNKAYAILEPDKPPPPIFGRGDDDAQTEGNDPRDRNTNPNRPEMPPVPQGGRSPLDAPDAAPGPAPRRDSPPAADPIERRPPGGAGSPGPLGARSARPPQAIQFEPSDTTIQNSPADGLLPLPDPPSATTHPISAPVSAEPLGTTTDPTLEGTMMPTPPPRRRSLIGGLFDSLGIRRR